MHSTLYHIHHTIIHTILFSLYHKIPYTIHHIRTLRFEMRSFGPLPSPPMPGPKVKQAAAPLGARVRGRLLGAPGSRAALGNRKGHGVIKRLTYIGAHVYILIQKNKRYIHTHVHIYVYMYIHIPTPSKPLVKRGRASKLSRKLNPREKLMLCLPEALNISLEALNRKLNLEQPQQQLQHQPRRSGSGAPRLFCSFACLCAGVQACYSGFAKHGPKPVSAISNYGFLKRLLVTLLCHALAAWGSRLHLQHVHERVVPHKEVEALFNHFIASSSR